MSVNPETPAKRTHAALQPVVIRLDGPRLSRRAGASHAPVVPAAGPVIPSTLPTRTDRAVLAASTTPPLAPVRVPEGTGPLARAVPGRTDTCAIVSAVCGITAIVPVVSQVAGLTLGVVSLLRVRRARRRGLQLRGRVWALIGIFSSGFALLGWIAAFVLLMTVANSLSHTGDVLRAALSVGG